MLFRFNFGVSYRDSLEKKFVSYMNFMQGVFASNHKRTETHREKPDIKGKE